MIPHLPIPLCPQPPRHKTPQVHKAAFLLKVAHLDRKEPNEEAPTNYTIKQYHFSPDLQEDKALEQVRDGSWAVGTSIHRERKGARQKY